MKRTQFFLPTLKETPADAEIVSHQLMLRAGLIRRLGSGLYSWMPLGLRVLRRVERIIRREMEAIGALEISLPAIHPAELWEETGRWSQFGPQMLKMKDRHAREFCFGPTHEEVITDLARRELKSYRQLPQVFYQIQTKFRDEIRPRFGVLRAREFLMKDGYSFHATPEDLDKTYGLFYTAYSRIFEALGLRFRAVLADTGTMGGALSHEFHVLAETGEDTLAFSSEGQYAANLELATIHFEPDDPPISVASEPRKVSAKGIRETTEQAKYLGYPLERTLKTYFVKSSDPEVPFVALVIPASHQLHSLKAVRLQGVAEPLEYAPEIAWAPWIQADSGFLGPVGLPSTVPLYVDRRLRAASDLLVGSNETDHCYVQWNWAMLPKEPQFADLCFVVAGEPSPDGQGVLQLTKGIEVGHIFQLGQKYSRAMQLSVLSEGGEPVVPYMGCYGIGVSRIVAAAIEQHHDERGIVWPAAMAPFDIGLMVLTGRTEEERQALSALAEELYQALIQAGWEVLWDDRPERPGVLFADFDLIGIPHRLVISPRGLASRQLEYKSRVTGEVCHLDASPAAVMAFLEGIGS